MMFTYTLLYKSYLEYEFISCDVNMSTDKITNLAGILFK